jgi:hypothetical protein
VLRWFLLQAGCVSVEPDVRAVRPGVRTSFKNLPAMRGRRRLLQQRLLPAGDV